jgi:hypothetical protein
MKAHSSKDPKLYVPDGHAGDMDIVNNGSGRLLDKDKEMSFEYNGETFKGAFEKRSLKSKTAKVLARYSDGSVAISEKEIGNGKAIYIGSNPSIGEWREDDYNFHSLLKDLLDIPNAFTELSEKIPEKITVECLVSGNRKLFFIFSHIESDERISLVGNFKILYAVNPDKDKITNRLLTVSALSTVIIESEK